VNRTPEITGRNATKMFRKLKLAGIIPIFIRDGRQTDKLQTFAKTTSYKKKSFNKILNPDT
jgi:hypothetical protein